MSFNGSAQKHRIEDKLSNADSVRSGQRNRK